MKIAMLTSSFDRSLQEEGFIPGWVEGLSKQVETLVVILLKPKNSTTNCKNIHFYELKSKNKLYKLWEIYRILSAEHQNQPFNGIFTHMYDFLGAYAGLWGKIYKVKSIFWYAGGIGLPRFSLLEMALKTNDQIVCPSEETKKRYQQRYSLKNPVIVLGHAIDTSVFKKLKIKKDLQVFRIGTVGRLARCKNYETLIQAVGRLKTTKKIKVSLVLARLNENKDYLLELKKLIKHYQSDTKIFEIIKNVSHDKLPLYYNSLDLYIHPSLVKSVDKAGLEAACCNTPVLLSSIGYQTLLSAIKGGEDYLFDPNNISSLVQIIIKIMDHKKLKSNKIINIKDLVSINRFMRQIKLIFGNN